MFCPNCGEKIIDNAAFCKKCGAKLDMNDRAQESQEKAEQSPVQSATYQDTPGIQKSEETFKTGGEKNKTEKTNRKSKNIRLVSVMRMDFELLEEIIEDLDESDSKIMKQYLLEGRLFKEIADDEGRTYEAIKKRMERIRAEIREEILECLEMNCRGGE